MAQHDLGISVNKDLSPADVSHHFCIGQTANAMETIPTRRAGWLWERPSSGQSPMVTIQAQCALVLRAVIYKPLLCVSQPDFFLSFLNFSFYIGEWPINNVVIVSGEQQRDSAIHIHVSIPPKTPLPSRLSQNIEQSSPCCIQQVLVGYLFQRQQCVHVHPKLNCPSS